MFHIGIVILSVIMAWFIQKVIGRAVYILSNKKIFKGKFVKGTAYISILFLVGVNISGFIYLKMNKPEGPNIIIILSDALRKDHLGCYGYERNTTPHIDAFSREATIFTNTYAQAPSTKPSVASIFTSLYPSQHQTIINQQQLPLSKLTLAEVLKQSGYVTAGFFENYNLLKKFQFNQGFNIWTPLERNQNSIQSKKKAKEGFDKKIQSWLTRNKNKPFFLYIHFLDPHNPYTPPPPFNNFFDKEYKGIIDGNQTKPEYIPYYKQNQKELYHLISLYDEEIRYTDFRFSKIIKKLSELEILEKSLVIFLSDHGEEFLEHGHLRHSTSVYSELINIPLIIRYPKLFWEKRELKNVQHIDIFPTILHISGIELPLYLEGKNILAEIPGKQTKNRMPENIISEYIVNKKKKRSSQRCLITPEWKLIHHIRSNSYSLFNIYQDPKDSINIINNNREIARNLKINLTAWERKMKFIMRFKTISLDKKTKEELKSLGYLN
jgi:arylsulfatase A-like enzyme